MDYTSVGSLSSKERSRLVFQATIPDDRFLFGQRVSNPCRYDRLYCSPSRPRLGCFGPDGQAGLPKVATCVRTLADEFLFFV